MKTKLAITQIVTFQRTLLSTVE